MECSLDSFIPVSIQPGERRALPVQAALPASQERGGFSTPRDIAGYFPEAVLIKPQNVVRPAGDSTLFTSSGIQYLETLERRSGKLPDKPLLICQPVIRSQFMDGVEPGVSSSFVNCSVIVPNAGGSDMARYCRRLTELALGLGARPDLFFISVEEGSKSWGSKTFDSKVITLYYNAIELGEVVLLKSYPFGWDSQKADLLECGFGIERLRWAVAGQLEPQTPSPQSKCDAKAVLQVQDAVRSMVLIAGEGVTPSNTGHGYRLRQFSKRFAESNLSAGFNLAVLSGHFFEYWSQWGYEPSRSAADTFKVIDAECQRNFNALVLKALREKHGVSVAVDINLLTQAFLLRLRNSAPPAVIERALAGLAGGE